MGNLPSALGFHQNIYISTRHGTRKRNHGCMALVCAKCFKQEEVKHFMVVATSNVQIIGAVG